MYKRVLLKLSGEALAGDGQALDAHTLKRLAKELKTSRLPAWNWPSLSAAATSSVER